MNIVQGNLIDLALQGRFDVIMHVCNCFHTMGAGIAAAIRETWPEAYEADVDQTRYGDIKKLGGYSAALVEVAKGKRLTILNLYSQYDFGGRERNLHYGALECCLMKVAHLYKNRSIGLPYMMGCGLAGGSWDIVSKIIARELQDVNYTVVKLSVV